MKYATADIRRAMIYVPQFLCESGLTLSRLCANQDLSYLDFCESRLRCLDSERITRESKFLGELRLWVTCKKEFILRK